MATDEIAADFVASDVPCITCGYNLRMQPESGRCPECGRPVVHSLDETLPSATTTVTVSTGPWGSTATYTSTARTGPASAPASLPTTMPASAPVVSGPMFSPAYLIPTGIVQIGGLGVMVSLLAGIVLLVLVRAALTEVLRRPAMASMV